MKRKTNEIFCRTKTTTQNKKQKTNLKKIQHRKLKKILTLVKRNVASATIDENIRHTYATIVNKGRGDNIYSILTGKCKKIIYVSLTD
jgi:hypothetical protein